MPDGSQQSGIRGVTTPMDIIKGISKSLANNSVVAKMDGEVWDLFRPLERDCALQVFSFDDPEGKEVRSAAACRLPAAQQIGISTFTEHAYLLSMRLAALACSPGCGKAGRLRVHARILYVRSHPECRRPSVVPAFLLFLLRVCEPCFAPVQTFWHSSAHVLGEALEACFGVRLTIGPAVEEGFYYDCYMGERTLTDAEKPMLEKKIEQVRACMHRPSRPRMLLRTGAGSLAAAGKPHQAAAGCTCAREGTHTKHSEPRCMLHA